VAELAVLDQAVGEISAGLLASVMNSDATPRPSSSTRDWCGRRRPRRPGSGKINRLPEVRRQTGEKRCHNRPTPPAVALPLLMGVPTSTAPGPSRHAAS